MRLIDADALIAEYDRVHIGEPGKARKLIEDAPTIEPERTGKWIDCNNSEHWKCSECGYRGPYSWDDQHGFEEWLSDYCPNCGARMES